MLLSVDQARRRLLASLAPPRVVRKPLAEAAGRVLGEAILSDVDLPPFSNSSMDGFAVQARDIHQATEGTPVALRVVGDIPAGTVAQKRLLSGQAMRIMTGAPLPEGADAVVPVEDTDFHVREAGVVPPAQVLIQRSVEPGAYVRPRGEDLQKGAPVMPAGRRLRPQDLGMLATLGIADVPVTRQPIVAILSTGDELLPVEAPLEPGKIRESNSYMLAAQVQSCGGQMLRMGIVRDSADDIRASLQRAVTAGADLILSSAGVSVGAFDFVRQVVAEHGQLDFWRVNMRPGKPLAFGQYQGIPFIGLPGNPVSAFVGFEVFLRPALMQMVGDRDWRRQVIRVQLAQPVESDGRESYLRVQISAQHSRPRATLTGHQGSGNLYSLVQANGLLVVPAGVAHLPEGAEADAWPL